MRKKLATAPGWRLEEGLHTSRFNIEGEGRKEEIARATEETEGRWSNRTHTVGEQNCETVHKDRLTKNNICPVHVLKCLYTNANSVISKIDELRDRVLSEAFDVIAITETWATEDISDCELVIDGYVMYRKDRQ